MLETSGLWIVLTLLFAVEETETEVTFDRKINENRNNEQEYSCFAKCNPVNQAVVVRV